MKPREEFLAVACDALPWNQALMPNGDPKGIKYRRILGGGDGLPQAHFNSYEPHWTEARHRHVEDEVLILVKGEIQVEGQTYHAPTVLFVGRLTLYGPLTAGANGADFYRVAYTEKMIQRAPEQDALSNSR
jgi:hypothetical protein